MWLAIAKPTKKLPPNCLKAKPKKQAQQSTLSISKGLEGGLLDDVSKVKSDDEHHRHHSSRSQRTKTWFSPGSPPPHKRDGSTAPPREKTTSTTHPLSIHRYRPIALPPAILRRHMATAALIPPRQSASPCLVPHSHHQPPCHYRATSHIIGKASLPSVAHANLPTPSVTAFRCRWCHPHRATRINDLSRRCQARLLALPLRPTAATGHCQPPPGFLPSPPPPPSSRRRHHLGVPTVNGAPLCSSSSSALPPPHSRTPPASPLAAARGPTSHAGETGSRREGTRSSSGRCPPSCQRFLSPIDSGSQAFARQLQPSVAAAVVAPELIGVVGSDPMTSGKRKALPPPSLRPRRFLRLAQVAVRRRMEGSGGGGAAAEVTAPRERSGGPRMLCS